jgi:hypothetical protein
MGGPAVHAALHCSQIKDLGWLQVHKNTGGTNALFSYIFFKKIDTVVFLFVFNKYYSIID